MLEKCLKSAWKCSNIYYITEIDSFEPLTYGFSIRIGLYIWIRIVRISMFFPYVANLYHGIVLHGFMTVPGKLQWIQAQLI